MLCHISTTRASTTAQDLHRRRGTPPRAWEGGPYIICISYIHGAVCRVALHAACCLTGSGWLSGPPAGCQAGSLAGCLALCPANWPARPACPGVVRPLEVTSGQASTTGERSSSEAANDGHSREPADDVDVGPKACRGATDVRRKGQTSVRVQHADVA